MNKGYKVEDRKVKWSLDHDQCKCIFPGIMAWSVLISLCSSFFFSQSRNWRGRSVSSIPGGVYIAPAVAGCVRFLDLAGRAGFNLQAPTDIYTGCTCVKMFDSKPNVSARDICGIILINSCTDELFYESKVSAMNSFWETLCPFYYAHYISWEQKFFPVKMIIKSSL